MSEHDEKCERDERGFYLCHCSRRQREARGLTDVPTQPLEFPPPDCPSCKRPLYHDGDGWQCDRCSLEWDSNGTEVRFTDDYGDDLAELAASWKANHEEAVQ